MSIKHNEPKFTDPATMACRGAVEHRATWMGLIYDELKKDGIDPEPAFRRAIKRCGNIHGANFKAACSNPDDCRDFADRSPLFCSCADEGGISWQPSPVAGCRG